MLQKDSTMDNDRVRNMNLKGKNYIICGRGQNKYNGDGNKRLRRLVASLLHIYMDTKTNRTAKSELVNGVTEQLIAMGMKFVKLSGVIGSKDYGWVELPYVEARNKIAHRFRDAARRIHSGVENLLMPNDVKVVSSDDDDKKGIGEVTENPGINASAPPGKPTSCSLHKAPKKHRHSQISLTARTPRHKNLVDHPQQSPKVILSPTGYADRMVGSTSFAASPPRIRRLAEVNKEYLQFIACSASLKFGNHIARLEAEALSRIKNGLEDFLLEADTHSEHDLAICQTASIASEFNALTKQYEEDVNSLSCFHRITRDTETRPTKPQRFLNPLLEYIYVEDWQSTYCAGFGPSSSYPEASKEEAVLQLMTYEMMSTESPNVGFLDDDLLEQLTHATMNDLSDSSEGSRKLLSILDEVEDVLESRNSFPPQLDDVLGVLRPGVY
jgi:hypothetical protein